MRPSTREQSPAPFYVAVSLIQRLLGSVLEAYRGGGAGESHSHVGKDDELDKEEHGGEALHEELHD